MGIWSHKDMKPLKQPDQTGHFRKGWVTPYGFADFNEPVSYDHACEEMKKAAELFWPKEEKGE